MMPFLLNVVLLVILLAFAADAYSVAKAKEAEDRLDAARLASMDAAMTDMAGRCWVCTTEARMLELVDIGYRFELACGSCADILKATTRQERAA